MIIEITEEHPDVERYNTQYFIYNGDIDEDEVVLQGNFIIDGNVYAGSVECEGKLIVRKNLEVERDVNAEDGLEVDQDATIGGSLDSNGNVKIGGSIKSENISFEGNLSVDGDVDVEDLWVKNNLVVGGALNCKKAEVGGMREIKGDCNIEAEMVKEVASTNISSTLDDDESLEDSLGIKP